MDKIKPWKFIIGAFFTPQYTGLAFAENPHPGGNFQSADKEYVADYLSKRRQINKMRSNFATGISVGAWVHNKWELQGKIGWQRIEYTEPELYQDKPIPTLTAYANSSQNIIATTTSSETKGKNMQNRLNYVLVSAGINRLYFTTTGLGFKAGIGVGMNRLLNNSVFTLVAPDRYSYSSNALSRWLLTPTIRFGIIEQLTRRVQLQACPVLFGSINSMYGSDHLIIQRAFGAGLEIGIYFLGGK